MNKPESSKKNVLYHSTWIDIYPGGGEACDRELISTLNDLREIKDVFLDSVNNKNFFKFFKSTYRYKLIGKFFRDIIQFFIILSSINSYLRRSKSNENKLFIFIYSGRIGGLYLLSLFKPNLKVIYNVHGICNKFFFKALYKKRNIKFILWGNAKDLLKILSLEKSNKKYINLIPSSTKFKLFKKEFIKQYPAKKNFCIKSKFKLIWIGRLEPIKNPMRLIDIAKKNINIEISIAGDGSLMNILKKEIKKENILNLKIYGHLDSKNLKKLISKSDFHIMTSKYENYPIVILESMANRLISFVPRISCFTSLNFPNLQYYGEDNILGENIKELSWNKDLEEKSYKFFEKVSKESYKKSLSKIIKDF